MKCTKFILNNKYWIWGTQHISSNHLADNLLTWSPTEADGGCLATQLPGPLLFPQGLVPRCEQRSQEAR